MAASVFAFECWFDFNYNQNSNVENQAQLVENQIKKQKDNFIKKTMNIGTGSGKSAE
jgi:hypothetical protein